MQLRMTGGAQDLPIGDNEIITGPMGDCVSVIVLWNLAGNAYANARGQHGFGGIEAIDFDTLFQGVPNQVTTQVIVIPGSIVSPRLLEKAFEPVRNEHRLSAVNLRIVRGRPNARVDLHAQVTSV